MAQVVRFVVAEVDAKHMQTFVAAKFEAAGADTPKEDAAVMAGVEHFLCVILLIAVAVCAADCGVRSVNCALTGCCELAPGA